MIQLTRPDLLPATINSLHQFQIEVNGQPDYPTCVQFAKTDWEAKKRTVAFNDVKAKLIQMCSGAERCHYCEDSKADEVEHILPKAVYPNLCYEWVNYFYSCGTCNSPKKSQCAVIDPVTFTLIDLTPQSGRTVQQNPTAIGITAIIDPVIDNPMNYFFLDIKDTFSFSEYPEPNTIEYKRAKYTLEILRLNERVYLNKARKKSYEIRKRSMPSTLSKAFTS